MEIINELWKNVETIYFLGIYGKTIFFSEIVKLKIDELTIHFNRIFRTQIITLFYHDIKEKDEIKESFLIASISNRIFKKYIDKIDYDKMILD